ncbi:MAG: 50S ribosomal protein L21 [Bacteriovoracales bacterium]|nr:50S ribosomal protein L21 [Bacteriovoracales bacterium]
MYSVLDIGGHQYRVQVGDLVDVQKLAAESGTTLTLDQVLFVGGSAEGEGPIVGAPLVEKAAVSAHVIGPGKGPKLTVFKRRPGLWQKKKGHRQLYTSLLITEIDDGRGNVEKIDKKSTTYKRFLQKKPQKK